MHTIVQEFRHTLTTDHAASRGALWSGRTMSGIAVAFLTLDAIGKLLQVQPVMDGTRQLGYPVEVVFGLGVTLMSCVLVYVVPRTAILGAILLTGYLGGAVATHVRVANPLFTHTLFPTYVAALLWGGLVLRNPRLRVFVPWRRPS
jgi:DoxX-like family